MKLYLIRHAESEHNVAQVYAGVTDSSLTNHGVLQIEKLAGYFRRQGVQFTRVFSSPLQRARVTANALGKDYQDSVVQSFVVPCLREKDFGWLEGKTLASRLAEENREHIVEPESHTSLSLRAKEFVDDYLFPVCYSSEASEVIAVVSHGIFLSALWRTLRQMCSLASLTYEPEASPEDHPVVWSNTGYLELELDVAAIDDETSSSHLSLKVLKVNSCQHLSGLKRTRGIGSSKHDPKQRKLDTIFKHRSPSPV